MSRQRLPDRLLFRLHGWIGLNLGLLLFIICFSGTVATLSHEIDWLLNPAIRAAPAAPVAERSWEQWYQATRKAHPGANVVSLTAPPAKGWAVVASISYGPTDLRHVYLHPDTSAVQGTFSQFNVARFFRSFHKQFYIYPGLLPHGIYVVGPLGVALLLSVMTAIGFYRMRWNDALLRQRSASPRIFWSSIHRAIGLWTLGFSLLFAVTGIWYLYERIAIDVGIPSTAAEISPTENESPVRADVAPLDLDASVELARQGFPEFKVRSVFFAQSDHPMLTMLGQGNGWLLRDAANRVVVDPHSGGVVTHSQRGSDLTVDVRVAHTMDPLHFGNFAGFGVKLLWGLAGLLISASILVGLRIWYLRTVRRLVIHRTPGITYRSLVGTLAVLALTIYGSVVNIGESIRHVSPQAALTSSTGPEVAGQTLANAGAGLVPLYVWLVVDGFVLTTTIIALWWFGTLISGDLGTAASPVVSRRRSGRT